MGLCKVGHECFEDGLGTVPERKGSSRGCFPLEFSLAWKEMTLNSLPQHQRGNAGLAGLSSGIALCVRWEQSKRDTFGAQGHHS